MNTKYVAIIFTSFLLTTSIFIYLMISGNIEEFITQLKWFLRATTPLFIITLFYISARNKK